MQYVNITALTAPAGAAAEVESRFSARARKVDTAPGFLGFELLRPVVGETRYFVVTRWQSRAYFETWLESRAVADHSSDQRDGMSVEVLGFEVVQQEG